MLAALLADRRLDSGQRASVDAVRREGEQLLRMVDRIVDLSGIDVGTLTHLRYLVGTELGDLDEVMEEYTRWLDERE